MKLLLVDDDEDVSAIIEEMLLELGVTTVVVVHSAEDALARLGQEDFGAILLDQQLPDMTGMELLRKIRTSDEKYQSRAIAMLSGDSDQTMKDCARLTGANYFLAKPCLLSQLEECLAALGAVHR